ncbi:MAG: hypothetical protein IJ702_00865 [Fretibacterium sp.]|nr:hypothetical protein [Fretibacterium sp.]
MKSAVPFAITYRTPGAFAGALQRGALRAVEHTDISFEEFHNRPWNSASRQEGRESYWKTRSKKLQERLALEAEIHAERQRQRASDQEFYARQRQQWQLNERAALSEQGMEPGMIGLTSLVPPVMQGTMIPIAHTL